MVATTLQALSGSLPGITLPRGRFPRAQSAPAGGQSANSSLASFEQLIADYKEAAAKSAERAADEIRDNRAREGGALRVNELAPRVHNSGHWSQDAGVTSQFSNHIRAITDTRPGNTQPALYAGMVNLLGREPDAALLGAADVNLHWYTKSVRSRRKVGHINVQAKDRARLQQRLAELEAALYPEGEPL